MPALPFVIELEGLEIARGFDGLLRGPPDPAILTAGYAVSGDAMHLADRMLHRFDATGPFPKRFAAAKKPRIAKEVSSGTGQVRFVVLTIALEEDGGDDVARLYGALERPARLKLFASDDPGVDVLSLSQLDDTWNQTRPAHLLVDGDDVSRGCKSDKWIGCVALSFAPTEPATWRNRRLNFLSPDERNDWTLFARTRC